MSKESKTHVAPNGSHSAKQLLRVRDLLARFHAVRKTGRLYSATHPATSVAVADLKAVVDLYHEEGLDVAVAFSEGELLFHNQIMPRESILFDQLIRDMSSLGVGSIEITRGVTAEELSRVVPLLSAGRTEIEAAGGIEKMLADAGLTHVRVGESRSRRHADQIVDYEQATHSYRSAIGLMREMDGLVRENRGIEREAIDGVVEGLVSSVLGNREAMLELSGLRSHDEYTFYHSANVAILSLALGSRITDDHRFLSSLGVGSLLHDVGKMCVDLSILNKVGPLSSDEWEEMQRHPQNGVRVALQVPGLDKSAIVMILEHHARYDGTGYPPIVPKRPQHLTSRIVAVADSYDAMTSRRSYSGARRNDEAMAILAKSAGKALDPALVRLFVGLLGVYPPRSVVRLSDGSTAVVWRPNESEPLRPKVKVIAEPSGAMIDPRVLDLAEEGSPAIECGLDPADTNVDANDYV